VPEPDVCPSKHDVFGVGVDAEDGAVGLEQAARV